MRPFIFVLLVGCSVESGEAAHPNPPQIASLGGDVLAAPKVVPIFFAGDAYQAKLEPFLATLAGSDYWDQTTSEYGVGPLAVAPSIVTTDPPPTTDAELTSWIAGKLATFDPQAIYTVYLPDGVVFQSSDGTSCQDFYGYHTEISGIVTALIPRCVGPNNRDTLAQLTSITSHELIEAATDPHFVTTPAFADVDADHYVWSYMPGAEVADMCEYVDAAYGHLVESYLVQRTWSNAAAAAGHDPCVPALPNLPAYYGIAAVLPDSAPIASDNGTLMTRAVHIAVGASKTIEVDLFADTTTLPWSVEAQDVASLHGAPAELAFAWDKTTGGNGDKLHLTITRLRAGGEPGSELVLYSMLNGEVLAMSAAYVD
jgi:hypothetical protein